jgi:hypothetical protein
MTQDEKYFPHSGSSLPPFGRGTGRFYPSSGTMIERITSGEHLLGFNVIGSYVVLRQKKDADLGLVYPSDYCAGHVAGGFIPKNAKRPNAAKLFMDYLLSGRAQKLMANQSMLFALRDDVEGPYSAAALSKELGSRLKPIPVDMSLLTALAPSQAPRDDAQMAGNRTRAVTSMIVPRVESASMIWLRLPTVVILAAVVLLPVGWLSIRAFSTNRFSRPRHGLSLASYAFILSEPDFARAFVTSVILAAGMTAIAVPLGGLLAFLVVRTDLPAKRADRARAAGADRAVADRHRVRLCGRHRPVGFASLAVKA